MKNDPSQREAVIIGGYWLLLFIALIVIEIITLGLTTIWFAAGSLVAFLLSLFHVPLPIQIIVFLVVSVILFVLTRPIAMKYFNKDREKTNINSVIGKCALVIEKIDNLHATGKVELDGMEWSARATKDTDIYQNGDVVQIIDVKGVKLIVKKEEK